jgi:hypothetical protein
VRESTSALCVVDCLDHERSAEKLEWRKEVGRNDER